eukprot:1811280-Prymnesium_polylepis.2
MWVVALATRPPRRVLRAHLARDVAVARGASGEDEREGAQRERGDEHDVGEQPDLLEDVLPAEARVAVLVALVDEDTHLRERGRAGDGDECSLAHWWGLRVSGGSGGGCWVSLWFGSGPRSGSRSDFWWRSRRRRRGGTHLEDDPHVLDRQHLGHAVLRLVVDLLVRVAREDHEPVHADEDHVRRPPDQKLDDGHVVKVDHRELVPRLHAALRIVRRQPLFASPQERLVRRVAAQRAGAAHQTEPPAGD